MGERLFIKAGIEDASHILKVIKDPDKLSWE